MKVEFITNLNRRYMAVCEKDGATLETGYVAKMILENRIDGILPVSRAGIDGSEILCYDITGKMSVSAYLNAGLADPPFFLGVLIALAGIEEVLQRYLIRRESIMVLPDQIIYIPEEEKFCFGVWPSGNEDYNRHMQKLAEFLISGLASGNHASAQMVYQFYQACIAGEVTAAEIRKITGSSLWQDNRERNREPVIEHAEEFFWDFSKEENPGAANKNKKKKEDAREQRIGHQKESQSKSLRDSGILKKMIRGLSRDHSGIRRSRQKKEDEKKEEFFRALIEGERKEETYSSYETQGTVLLQGNENRNLTDMYILESKDNKQGNFRLVKDNNIIGRETEKCDIVIRETTVSRVHARMIRHQDTFILIDTGSRNGTKVNGRTIPREVPFTLSDGDEIAFGKAEYSFRIRR